MSVQGTVKSNNMIDFMPPIQLKDYLSFRKAMSSASFHKVSLTFRGRDSIALASKHFKLGAQDTVLLPGYLCDIISAAFAGKCKLLYYDIRKDFSIDVNSVEDIFSKHLIKVFYIIHYFGFLHENLEQISCLCKKYGALLWEDHAHSVLSNMNYEYADAMFFSFRKILPVPDGGGIWLQDDSTLNLVSGGSLTSDILSLLLFAKRRLWCTNKPLRSAARSLARKDVSSLSQGRKKIIVRPVSHMSHRMIRSADTKRIVHDHRFLFDKWQRFIAGTRFEPVFSKLSEDVCPQGFPIWIANPDQLLRELEVHKVFLKIQWPLPEYLRSLCPVSWRISKSIITLPIYPGLSTADMESIITLLQRHGRPLSPDEIGEMIPAT